eukprot:TRINITY_DN877_c0_g1_i1.p1 TRINITY_DN877_c0_g1~~TRINITY_DN877_c0_g1_i1.p1  ORF type:complete len:265 (+),score=30.08 TRINITY_DN877_c0_g1_i1:541-1335(+)
MVGEDSLFSTQFVKNRLNPKVHSVFSLLLGEKKLVCNHDRCGFFRPTKWEIDGELKKLESWESTKNIHIDMNPWWYLEAPNSSEIVKELNTIKFGSKNDFKWENNTILCEKDGGVALQGLLNLEDNLPEDGGFQLVPGFYRHLRDFAKCNTQLRKRYYKPGGKPSVFIIMPTSLALQKQAVRISSRKGSLIIWNQLTLHGSAPNDSTRPRYAQFVKLFPAHPMSIERFRNRSQIIRTNLSSIKFKTNTLTQDQLKIVGIQQWEK